MILNDFELNELITVARCAWDTQRRRLCWIIRERSVITCDAKLRTGGPAAEGDCERKWSRSDIDGRIDSGRVEEGVRRVEGRHDGERLQWTVRCELNGDEIKRVELDLARWVLRTCRIVYAQWVRLHPITRTRVLHDFELKELRVVACRCEGESKRRRLIGKVRERAVVVCDTKLSAFRPFAERHRKRTDAVADRFVGISAIEEGGERIERRKDGRRHILTRNQRRTQRHGRQTHGAAGIRARQWGWYGYHCRRYRRWWWWWWRWRWRWRPPVVIEVVCSFIYR